MPMCAGLVGPKSENVEISLVLPLFFERSREAKVPQECKEVSERDRPGRGRGRVNPPPGACLEVLEVWRV